MEAQGRIEGLTGVQKVIAGLQILSKYGECIDAQHDVIYAGGTDPVSDEDEAVLLALGWHYESDIESWAKFT